MSVIPPEGRKPVSASYPWIVVGLLWFCGFFNYADRQSVTAVFPTLEKEFHLSKSQLGWIGSAFMLVYAPASPFAGYVVDRVSRRFLVVSGLAFWSIICALTGTARSYYQLLFYRAAEGLGESCYFPASMSVLADYHGPRTRSRAMSIHQTSVYVGTAGGAIVAGYLAQYYGWRTPFYVLGTIGFAYAGLLGFALVEPPREKGDVPAPVDLDPLTDPTDVPPPAPKGRSFGSDLAVFLSIPSAVLLLATFVGANFVASAFMTWLPAFIYDKFHQGVGGSALTSSYWSMASLVGALSSGVLADWAARRSAGGRILVQACGLIVAAPLAYLTGSAASFSLFVCALLGVGFCKGVYDANIFASLYDVIPAEIRGTSAGLMNTMGWTGGSLAPILIGYASELYGMSAAVTATAAVYIVAGVLALTAAALASRRARAHPSGRRPDLKDPGDTPLAAPAALPETRPAYAWARWGDVNAFFGLMLDNVSNIILMAGLLVGAFGMPAEFVLTRMIPGTAVGVLVGDLIYTALAFRLARRSGRPDVTAMPLGLDTPSTFGTVFLVLGPVFQAATGRGLEPVAAARHAWFVGIAMLLASGLFKLACALVSDQVRRIVPRAGLLGSLTAIALVIISFLPLLDIAAQPVAGFAALAVILATLTARWRLPREFPGALAALAVGCAVYYGMYALGLGPGPGAEGSHPAAKLRVALPIPLGEWLAWLHASWREAAGYLPVALPLALATVVGGIDCTESAAAAGDDYPTGQVIAVEGLATIAGGIFGGVIQSTPYIGHPAYKAMGARAAYTLATALFVGAAGILGTFDWIFFLIPKPVIFPILIFVGLEITAQSFQATARRHYPAVALACVPALAYLSLIALNQLLPEVGKPFAALRLPTQHWIQTVTVLSGGFIVTSLLWGTALAHLIDGRARAASATLALAGLFAWFGVIHSPLPAGPITTPSRAIALLKAGGREQASEFQTPYHWAAAYAAMAAIVLTLGRFKTDQLPENAGDPERG